jgi:hypothetical protein
VLFISGTLDAKTPISNAEEIKRGFPKGMHLIIDGATHCNPLFLSSPKIKDVGKCSLESWRFQPAIWRVTIKR